MGGNQSAHNKRMYMINKILRNIVNWFWNFIYPELSNKEVEEIYSICKTPFQLETYLCSHGFKWASDGLNFSIETDSFERPNQLLSRKWGNCSGFLRLYSEFFDRIGVKHEEIMLLNTLDKSWHYINIFEFENKYYMQSNISLTEADNFDKIWEYWKTKGYDKKLINII